MATGSQLKLYNSLSRRIEEFAPITGDLVTMYSCGPTVYDFAHIGNFRSFALTDSIQRVLLFNGYKTRVIMNFTDVGHLTDDADAGEDKLEVAAEKEGRAANAVADYYIDQFLKDRKRLNLMSPTKFVRATDYVDDMIDLVKRLEEKRYTYQTSDGVYFDTSRFRNYGKLAGIVPEEVEEGARVDVNDEKKNPTDFALWKFSPEDDKKRWQEWASPWGVGFPGWHIECSAMILKELGETIDIHVGGEDHKMLHHPNEIAQSECATGKRLANYWLHNAFLQVDGQGMSKSLNNFYTIADVEERGFEALSVRYLYMSAHYRTSLNFTWEALQNAQNSLKKLYDLIAGYKVDDRAAPIDEYLDMFLEAINEDINMPKALAVVWELVKDGAITEESKVMTVLKMDEVLGFNFEQFVGYEIPQKVLDMAKIRNEYRKVGIWDKADVIRREIEGMGYGVEDIKSGGYKVKRKLI